MIPRKLNSVKIPTDLVQKITAPIIVDDHADVQLFMNLEAVIQEVEPIDVKNEEFLYYDSAGRQLFLTLEGDHVAVRDGGLNDNSIAVLRNDLQYMLQEIGKPAGEDADLADLVTAMRQVVGVRAQFPQREGFWRRLFSKRKQKQSL